MSMIRCAFLVLVKVHVTVCPAASVTDAEDPVWAELSLQLRPVRSQPDWADSATE